MSDIASVPSVDERVEALKAFQANIQKLDHANLDEMLERALSHLQSADLMTWYKETSWRVQENVDGNTVSELSAFWIKAAQEAIEGLSEEGALMERMS